MTSNRALSLAFVAMLALRFSLPLSRNPLRSLESDYLRHWDNASHVLRPNMMGAVDPKLYQVWLWGVRKISHDHPLGVALAASIMSVLFAWLWYRVCRELFDRNSAKALCVVLGLLPSLALCFTRTMTETITLTMLAMSLWLALRSARLRTLSSGTQAAAVVAAGSLSRFAIMPVLAGCLLLVGIRQRRRIWFAMLAAVALAACWIPAGFHTYRGLGIFAPLQFSTPTAIYRKAFTNSYRIRTETEEWSFTSPSMLQNPFDPLAEYWTSRRAGEHWVNVRTADGTVDWDLALALAREKYTWSMFRSDLADNVVFFCFGAQWPHAFPASADWMEVVNYHIRWIWAPLIGLVLIAAPFARVSPPQAVLLLLTLTMIVAHFVQQSGVMEGRFRVVVEPLILTSAWICVSSWREPGSSSMYRLLQQRVW